MKIVVDAQSFTGGRKVICTLSPGRRRGDVASRLASSVGANLTYTATRWAFPSPKFDTATVASTKSGTNRSGCETSPLIVQSTCGRVHHSRPIVASAVASATPAPIHAESVAQFMTPKPPTLRTALAGGAA